MYLTYYIGSTLAFIAIFNLLFYFFSFTSQEFRDKTHQQKLIYSQMWAGNSHHVTILFFVVYNFMYSECEGSYPLIFFYDDVCFYNIDRSCVRTTLITCGYLTYDFLLLSIYFTKERPITYQTIGHHIVAMVVLLCAFHTGYSMGTLTTATLVCEFSSVFLNYRSIFIERKIKTTIAFVNQVVFFFTFFFTRIIMLPIL